MHVGLIKRLTVNYDTPSPRQYLNFNRHRFLKFFIVWRHVTFKLRVFHLWQANFSSYDRVGWLCRPRAYICQQFARCVHQVSGTTCWSMSETYRRSWSIRSCTSCLVRCLTMIATVVWIQTSRRPGANITRVFIMVCLVYSCRRLISQTPNICTLELC